MYECVGCSVCVYPLVYVCVSVMCLYALAYVSATVSVSTYAYSSLYVPVYLTMCMPLPPYASVHVGDLYMYTPHATIYVYVCVCICICVCMYGWMDVYMPVCICIYVCLCVCMTVCMCVGMNVCMPVWHVWILCMCVFIGTCVYV